MQVRDVLKTKGGRVISIDPEASVAEAAVDEPGGRRG